MNLIHCSCGGVDADAVLVIARYIFYIYTTATSTLVRIIFYKKTQKKKSNYR